MKNNLVTLFALLLSIYSTSAQPRTIHVMVALCDNAHQGIVPVPSHLGNGKDPAHNLYWGAAYGVKSFFKKSTSGWILLETSQPKEPGILERVLYKHASKDVYLLADAYDGEQIKLCIENFLKAANGQHPIGIPHNTTSLAFGGGADLLAYVGHDGLMEFNVSVPYVSTPAPGPKKETIILACYSKSYFQQEIKKANATPLLWTTHLMAPEAYTLKAAIEGWILGEKGEQIEERAALTYHQYQKCGIKGARNLFATGF